MSRNVAIALSFLTWSFDFSSTIRSPLPSLVTSMVPSPRIDLNSLRILKGDLSVTFADFFELITIHFLNGDHFAKGDMLISVGRSSAFLLLATETAPRAASVQAPGLPAHHRSQIRGHIARISSAVPGLPWSYTPSRGCGTSIGVDPCPIQRKLTSGLGSVGQEKEMAKEACW
ncbi:hypothetical protein PoB_004603300 [Plakobranchus ocellatus]|uniref:Uncharacterized protein n=1 Tax=Plakobranchus ocellatus TaxID=259542 RepID=A0AAV4BL35_9GAST|nr:hypothetical protein PoB_004603300 [Plakobranchus ocellatus]